PNTHNYLTPPPRRPHPQCSHPRRAIRVWIPIPTSPPVSRVSTSSPSSDSSPIRGSPQRLPVAAARTYNQRGVITATPKDLVLGLTRWTRGMPSNRSTVKPVRQRHAQPEPCAQRLRVGR